MCNRWKNERSKVQILDEFSQIKLPLFDHATATANRGLTGDIKPTDPAFVLRSNGDFEILKWGWPSNRGPVINVRDDRGGYKREGRGLVRLTSFYETTEPKDPKQKNKDWWEFIPTGDEPVAFAVTIKGDAFSLITTDPGEDIIPIHDRQPTILPQRQWEAWLTDDSDWDFQPSPPGSWTVRPKDFSKPEPSLL